MGESPIRPLADLIYPLLVLRLPVVFSVWGELLEHLVDRLVQGLLVFLRVLGERVGGRTTENQLFVRGVVEIDDQRADAVGVHRCGGLAETAPSPAAHSVIEGPIFLLILA